VAELGAIAAGTSVADWFAMQNSTKLLTSALALCALGGLSVGCTNSSPGSSSSLDANGVLGKFQHPTGSFSNENGGAAFSSYQSKKDESSHVAIPNAGGGSGTSSTQSMHILSTTADAQCAAGATCACAKGGSYSYQKDTAAENPTVNFRFDSCQFDNGSGFDGVAELVVSDQPLVGVKKMAGVVNSAADAGAASTVSTTKNFVLTAKGTGSDGGKSMALEFSLAQEAGYVLLSVDMADGNIVIGIAKDGTAFVKAKQGTWNCTPSASSGYSCTSEDGGAPVAIANRDATSGAPAKSGTTTGVCALQPGDSACDACVASNCCAAIQACNASAECGALMKCGETCNHEQSCLDSCKSQHSAGVSPLEAVFSCMENRCTSQCQ
jgi:hypothetical protein